ncbi:MAG TPA: TlpA disulfide reductase family protein [bacterium]|jgi:thiol-disulfide isomerase/thioredoxin
MSTRRTFLLILILFSLSAIAAAATPAPSFTLPLSDGQISLDSLRGHVVYLDFWASWCAPCRQSFPWMDQLTKKYADQGLIVLAINLDAKRDAADKFLAAHPVSFTVAYDSKATVPPLYNVKAMPSTFIINKDGTIAASHIGFQEKDTADLEKQVMESLEK